MDRTTSMYFHTMGRAFRVTATFRTDTDANAHMERNPDDAVIGERNGFIILADRHDQGEKVGP